MATFISFLTETHNDTVLSDMVISQIKKNINIGAKDLTQNWKNALDLVNKAYKVSNVAVPTIHTKQWHQYENLIKYSVNRLSTSRGLAGTWRMTNSSSNT